MNIIIWIQANPHGPIDGGSHNQTTLSWVTAREERESAWYPRCVTSQGLQLAARLWGEEARLQFHAVNCRQFIIPLHPTLWQCSHQMLEDVESLYRAQRLDLIDNIIGQLSSCKPAQTLSIEEEIWHILWLLLWRMTLGDRSTPMSRKWVWFSVERTLT